MICEKCGAEIDWNLIRMQWEDEMDDSVFRGDCPEGGRHMPKEG